MVVEFLYIWPSKSTKKICHLLDTKQIIKLDKFSDTVFISPVVISVKHDKYIKTALDSKLLSDAIEKNKYQMRLRIAIYR